MHNRRFDLEKAVAAWRRPFEHNRAFSDEDVEELESSLRDRIAALLESGHAEEAAFREATRRMGAYGTAETEYRKVYWGTRRRRGEVLSELQWRGSMLKNYLTIALRNLKKHRGYSFINVTGLAIGIACCLLILLFVRDELSFDRFHAHADRIYRIQSDWGGFSLPTTNPPTVRHLKAEHPEITLAQFIDAEALLQVEDRRFQESHVLMTTPAFFDVFSFEMVRGDGKAALSEPFNVILTESTARRYFGDRDPIGRTLTVVNNFDVTVAGVAADPLPNSHIQFSLLGSWATIDAVSDFARSDGWTENSIYTYFLLPEGYDPATLEAQFPAFIERHAGDDWNGSTLSLQAMTDVHLRSHHNSELTPNGQEAYVYVFSAIALFILLVACVNFMNLATARSAERAKEVGVRKVVGARRGQLVGQFLAESVVLSLLALVLAVGLTALGLPAFRALSGKPLDVGVLTDGPVVAGFLLIALAAGVLAGSYPAFFLSAFRPVAVLKGRLTTGRRGAGLRKGLVIFQFATSMFLIVGTAVVFDQLSFLQNAHLGFDRDQIVTIQNDEEQVWATSRAFREAVRQIPGIERIAPSAKGLPDALTSADGVTLAGATDGGEHSMFTRSVSVGHGFFETLGAEMAHGRAFSPEFPTDSAGYVLNEAAVRGLMARYPDQIPSIDRAVGMEIVRNDRPETRGTLLGIVKDFNMTSLHEPVEPTIFFIDPNRYTTYLLRVRTGDLRATMSSLEATWTSMYPNLPFSYGFADEAFGALYRSEERLAQIFTFFAGLAVLIACLGLFGLASFTAQARTKEIGVRKALGASVPHIVALLSREIVALIGVAVLLATPLSYLAMHRWLAGFAYHIDLSTWVFLAAGLAVLGIALLTVSYQSIRAALANPVKSLRYE